MGKRKPDKKPKKLTDFYTAASTPRPQDGAEASDSRRSSGSGDHHPHHTQLPSGAVNHRSRGESGGSTPIPSPINSPQKSSQKRSVEHRYAGGPEDTYDSQNSTRDFVEQIHDFPTSGVPLSDTVMRDMLVTLRGSMHKDMMLCVSQLKRDVSAIGDRISHVEDRMGDFTIAHNELVDAHNDTEGEIQAMRDKLADLEDRSRRNNIKLRGVEESVSPSELRHYVQEFIAAILPEVPSSEVIVDRAHRLPKPKFLPEKVPRDVIARVHFFHIKDDLMRFSRKNQPLPAPYSNISVYSDLSQHTMMARKNLSSITKLLQNSKITYSWGFPTKLLITRDNRTFAIRNVEEGIDLAKKWNLLPEDAQDPRPTSSPARLPPEWSNT